MITTADQNILLKLAHDSIAYCLTNGREMLVDASQFESALQEKRSTFVTLGLNGELRGCIGTLKACRPLVQDIAHNAYAAAFCDPRFAPLTTAELRGLKIQISILSHVEELKFNSEEELLTQLRPHVDGLILSEGRARGTFLPCVWESLPEPCEFLAHLKLKAGLPPRYWSDAIQVKRYTTMVFP